jgi:hypothetical protein
MSAFECPREHEVVAAVLSRRLDRPSLDEGGWPGASDDDLGTHADACDVCREAATVASLLHEDARAARAAVRVPSAGQVWWRAAIRARVEAAQAAERPMTWVHGLAGACATGVVVTLLGLAWPSVEGAVAWVAAQSWSVPAPMAETARLAIDTLQRGLPIALLAVACVILAPLAIYLTIADE